MAKPTKPSLEATKAKPTKPSLEAVEALNTAVEALDRLVRYRRENELSDTRARNARNVVSEIIKTILDY